MSDAPGQHPQGLELLSLLHPLLEFSQTSFRLLSLGDILISPRYPLSSAGEIVLHNSPAEIKPTEVPVLSFQPNFDLVGLPIRALQKPNQLLANRNSLFRLQQLVAVPFERVELLQGKT